MMRVALLLLFIKIGRFKSFLVVEKGVKVGTSYLCTGHTILSTLIVSEKNGYLGIVVAIEQGEKIIDVDSEITLWHNRIGHMSEKGKKLLLPNKVLLGLKCVNMNFCESM